MRPSIETTNLSEASFFAAATVGSVSVEICAAVKICVITFSEISELAHRSALLLAIALVTEE